MMKNADDENKRKMSIETLENNQKRERKNSAAIMLENLNIFHLKCYNTTAPTGIIKKLIETHF